MLWWTLRQLKSKDWRKRVVAASKAGQSKNPRAVQPLLDALEDETYNVRTAAATALGEIKDKQAVEPLVNILNDKDEKLRKAAIQARQSHNAAQGFPIKS